MAAAAMQSDPSQTPVQVVRQGRKRFLRPGAPLSDATISESSSRRGALVLPPGCRDP